LNEYNIRITCLKLDQYYPLDTYLFNESFLLANQDYNYNFFSAKNWVKFEIETSELNFIYVIVKPVTKFQCKRNFSLSVIQALGTIS
jgi:hypothetical protein